MNEPAAAIGFWFEGLRVYRRDGYVHLFMDMGGTETPDHWTMPDDPEAVLRLLLPLVQAFPEVARAALEGAVEA